MEVRTHSDEIKHDALRVRATIARRVRPYPAEIDEHDEYVPKFEALAAFELFGASELALGRETDDEEEERGREEEGEGVQLVEEGLDLMLTVSLDLT